VTVKIDGLVSIGGNDMHTQENNFALLTDLSIPAGLEVHVMAEVPSNIILADQFADRFDGFSIDPNDLTQLVLGVDRDTSEIVHLFDERNPAVKQLIRRLI
jgi:phosphoenolpyruvate synthase/pyruvate phosphate dikinase